MRDLKAIQEALMRSGFVTPLITWWWNHRYRVWNCRTNYPYNAWGNKEHVYLIGDVPPRYPVPSTIGPVNWGEHTIVFLDTDFSASLELACYWLKQHRSIRDES